MNMVAAKNDALGQVALFDLVSHKTFSMAKFSLKVAGARCKYTFGKAVPLYIMLLLPNDLQRLDPEKRQTANQTFSVLF